MGNAEFPVGRHRQRLCRRQATSLKLRILVLSATRALPHRRGGPIALHREFTNDGKSLFVGILAPGFIAASVVAPSVAGGGAGPRFAAMAHATEHRGRQWGGAPV
jgi:hypothetical protein